MRKYVIGFILNLLAGAIIFFCLPILQKHVLLIGLITALTAFTITILLMFPRLHRFRRFGIANMLTSVEEGKGSTTSILMTVHISFTFMGIAARRWINTGLIFERVIKKIANPNSPVKFLLLDPDSQEAVRQSKILKGNDHELPENIRDSIRKFKVLRNNGCSIDVRLYEFLPVFRIAFVDDQRAYVGFYRAGMAHEDSPQLVLVHDSETGYFQPYKDYFEIVWKTNSKEVNWSKY